MAFRLITKNATAAALARPAMLSASRQSLGAAAVRHYTTQKEVEPKEKANSIINALPGNSLVSKTGYLTLGTGIATFMISKEIYVFNEETLVLVASTGLLGLLLKYLREPFTNMANEHIERIKNVLVQARDDHKTAVKERINEVGQMKDLVDVTKALFELSRETAKLEAEAFTLKQQVAVANEVKATLDSWVRHEANVREREQKQLAAHLIEKINKDLQDPKIQQQILEQAIVDVQKIAKTH
ncbi:ATP synthase subunit 4, mitochondrial [Choanephora cucurbitarum]|uniref:ATP synthase subunit 4 n=1 Tax=Choanephora cucurbitarum TaxID=101091 RepID=A0A1C7NNW7_9FUNG|nr:ATP synthase subunit 4, mitochondrial [Choanephora cucurbitarum]